MLTGAGPERHGASGAGATLPRAARLIKASDFTKVFKDNEASSDRLFRVLWRPGEAACSRLGMAVSRKVDRSAVGRNRIRRVVRESFRHWRARRDEGGRHYDIVVVARPAAAGAGNAELVRALENHWQRIGRHQGPRGDGAESGAPRATRKVN